MSNILAFLITTYFFLLIPSGIIGFRADELLKGDETDRMLAKIAILHLLSAFVLFFIISPIVSYTSCGNILGCGG